MNKHEEEMQLVAHAIEGNKAALETLLGGVQDMVFNLSLRMLGQISDAEDAAQEILLRVMTHLSSFQGQSQFSTWVFRIAVNYLNTCRKGMFAQRPLSFEIYGEDIECGRERDVPDMSAGVDKALLEKELKLSCSNVMLQCFDAQSRCIYILGTMFRLDSRVAAEILDMTPEAYRQRLSRLRKKMGEFLSAYCGLSGTGKCACARRTNYAIATHRLDPARMEYQAMETCAPQKLAGCGGAQEMTEAMEQLDAMSQIFAQLPAYRTPAQLKTLLQELINSKNFARAVNTQEAASCK